MNWPLMYNNITEKDAEALVKFLSQRPVPILTNNKKVREFEQKWSEWLGVKHSVFVNSGNSANLITLATLKERLPPGKNEVIVAPLNWISDITSILYAGFNPVFCDVNLSNLAISEDEIAKKMNPKTAAIIVTHILGYNGMTQKILDIAKSNNILLIEDACESHGATFNGKKIGTFGDISNFSFYYAHHMTSIEGGMICTNNEIFYEYARMFRAHGMVREADSEAFKKAIYSTHPNLDRGFVFLVDGYNMRSTELNAVMALSQLQRLDENNAKRRNNFKIFLNALDPNRFYTKFNTEGSCNYAFTVLLKDKDYFLRDRIEQALLENGVEYRRGMSGGGNQLRQPYLIKRFGSELAEQFTVCEHIHQFGWYIGNYPELEESNINWLATLLNSV